MNMDQAISHYQILEVLGRGGMGVVYRALDTRLGRHVAIKVIEPGHAADEHAKRRFMQEARAASALDHPHICTVHDVGEQDDGCLYLVMAFYEGQTLAQRLARGPLEPDFALSVARDVAAGLVRAHESGVVHRDIKPANIMLPARGATKILDFGLAKLAGEAALTHAGMVMGTIDYMSPEQAAGGDVDHRSDIWSLGVVLHEMLAGRRPFGEGSPASVLHAIIYEPPRFSLPAEIPSRGALQSVIENALARDRDRRYPSAQAFLDDLERLRGDNRAHTSTITRLSTLVKPQQRSILVLPLTDLSPGGDSEYFSDGLTDEIITDLSSVRTLRVISRTSAIRYKGTTPDMRQIAGDLHVQYVLEGSVRKSGNRLRVNVKLVDATTDTLLWAEKYGGELDDVFAIQESISREIVEALQVHLSDEEEDQLTHVHFTDAAAYDLYLRAKRDMLSYTADGLHAAERALDEAIAVAGEHPLLLTALGQVYWQYVNAGISSDRAYIARARTAAERVLKMDGASAHGHRLLGMVLMHEGALQDAVRHLRRALALQPNDPETLSLLIPCCGFVGRPYAGASMVERLLAIDPLTPMYQYMPGLLAMMGGIFDRAQESFERALAMDPGNPVMRLTYGQVLALNQAPDRAIRVFDELARDLPGNFFAALGTCYRHALAGDADLARAALSEDVLAVADGDLFYAWNVAECCALIGDHEQALDWVERAIARGFLNFPLLSKLDPLLEPLRGMPRFERAIADLRPRWDAFDLA